MQREMGEPRLRWGRLALTAAAVAGLLVFLWIATAPNVIRARPHRQRSIHGFGLELRKLRHDRVLHATAPNGLLQAATAAGHLVGGRVTHLPPTKTALPGGESRS